MNLKKSLIAALSIATVISSIAPASAMPIQAPTTARQVTANVDQIQYRRWDHREGWYHGHRGYRDRRPGFRFYNGFWFPNAAFSFGFSVGRDRDRDWDRGDRSWARHVDWCYDRYRSYRESDNTFQPYNGPRRECISPYS